LILLVNKLDQVKTEFFVLFSTLDILFHVRPAVLL